jgi:uncharacterized protein YchJ
MTEGFGREPSPLNIPNSGKSPKRKKTFWETQNFKKRDKTKNKKYVYLNLHGAHSSIGDGRHKLKGFYSDKYSEAEEGAIKLPGPTELCACDSGHTYRQCCGLHHQSLVNVAFNGQNEVVGPTDILKARYSAYKYGLSHYVIESSHPKNPDYIKFIQEAQAKKRPGSKRWERVILDMTKKFNFMGLDIVNIDTRGDTSNIIFRTLLQEKEEESTFMAIEERATFLKVAGRWLYLEGETCVPERDVVEKMIEVGTHNELQRSQANAIQAGTVDTSVSTTRVLKPSKAASKTSLLHKRSANKEKEGNVDSLSGPLRLRPGRKSASAGLKAESPIRPFRSLPGPGG